MFKRTIILNSLTKGDNRKAVVVLSGGEVLGGEVKLFNFGDAGKLALGVYDKQEVIKIPLEFKGGVGSFRVNKYVNIEDTLTCALVDLTHARFPEVILGGITHEGDYGFVEAAFLENSKTEELYETESDEELTKLIDKEIYDDAGCESCAGCKYKKAFYDDETTGSCANEQRVENKMDAYNFDFKEACEADIVALPKEENKIEAASAESTAEVNDLEAEILFREAMAQNTGGYAHNDQNKATGFLGQIRGQIDDMFEKHSKDEELEGLIEGSKWVRVNYEEDDSFYVLGLIFESGEVKYIAYGLPSESKGMPPVDLREYAQWLPVTGDPVARGYWVVYQDALSGENITMEEVI